MAISYEDFQRWVLIFLFVVSAGTVKFVGVLKEDTIAPETYVGLQLDDNSKWPGWPSTNICLKGQPPLPSHTGKQVLEKQVTMQKGTHIFVWYFV